MTVNDLMEILQEFKPDLEIFVQGENYQDDGLTTPIIQAIDGFIVIS